MICYTKGNLLESDAEALVNTVNTVGVMGKGIALLFKERFVLNFKLYKKACENGEVKVGKMFITKTEQLTTPYYIINFPTKRHWRQRSQYAFVSEGLKDLVQQIQKLNISSIAIPPLGCGNGGLEWDKVRELIEEAFTPFPHLRVFVYEPSPVHIPSPEKELALTPARAMILALLVQYKELGYQLTLLEVQKLAYFLQEAGEELRLHFKPHYYGPYAHNLQKLLVYLDGTYLRANHRIANIKNPEEELFLNEDKTAAIQKFIEENCTPEQRKRLETVSAQIQGYQTPFGMELLATVHWAKKNAKNLEEVIQAVYAWPKNPERKKRLFLEKHIERTWLRLLEVE